MKTIFTFLFINVALFGFGQNTFQSVVSAPVNTSGNFTNFYPYQLTQLNDGSFVTVGGSEGNFSSLQGFLLKTDSNGAVLASKIFKHVASVNSIVKTSDGGFVVCTNAYPNLQLIKFAADLTILWQKDYTVATGSITMFKMAQTEDGGFLLGGVGVSGDQKYTALAIKTDSTGNIEFAKRYFDYDGKNFTDITPTTDGNYALLATGSIYTNGVTHDSAFVIKIKPDGSLLWAKAIFSNALPEKVSAGRLISSSDGGIIITASLYTDYTNNQAAMIKYDNAGKLLWAKSMVLPDGDVSYRGDVTEDRDGGYLFCSSINNYNDVEDVVFGYIIKTNTSGELQWTKKYDPVVGRIGASYEFFNSIIKTADGGYATCGNGVIILPFTPSYSDIGSIFKLNENFEVCYTSTVISEGSNRDFATDVTITANTEDVIITTSDTRDTLIEGFSAFTVCHSNALPLQFLSFNASLQSKSVAVQWTTANEVNTSYFTVERSNNAASFTALQQVAAKGNSAAVQTYNTTDLQPLPGTSYYRLKEVDKDGKITYSSIVPVTMLSNGAVIISPNPVRDAVRVIMQSTANASITCQVIDMKGTVLATQKTSVSTGRNEIVIPAASLAKGVYVLKVIENNTTQTIRFVKE